jgi:hypothetical protein
VLLIGLADRRKELAPCLFELGVRPISVSSVEAARLRVERETEPVRGALLPLDASFLAYNDLRRLPGMRLILVGPRPDRGTRDMLRHEPPHALLIEPFTLGQLRFLVNGALYGGGRGEERQHVRVPTELHAHVRIGVREKAARVYGLSVAGCFLETERPNVEGTLLAVQLPFADGSVEAAGRVLYTNVPGSFARGKLPRGMAVQFVDLGPTQRDTIRRYVEERAAAHELRPIPPPVHAPAPRPRGMAGLWRAVWRRGAHPAS